MKVRVDVATAVARRVPRAYVRILVRRWTAAARRLGADPSGVSIKIVDDAEMSSLHWDHMQLRGPTDVLSFPAPADAVEVVGDIVIDWDAAMRQAAGRPLVDEVTDLGVHGLAHLMGHDHDPSKGAGRAAARAMLRAETRAARAARIPAPRRPYGSGGST